MDKKELLGELELMKTNLETNLEAKSQKLIQDAIAGLEAKITTIKGLPEGTDLTKMASDIAILSKDFNEMQKEAKKLAVVLPQAKSLAQALVEAYAEKETEIKDFLEKGAGPLRFDLKAAVTITETGTILAAGSASHYTLTDNTGIISPIRQRILTYLANVTVGSIGKPYAMWIEELDEQGTPVFIAENTAKTQVSVRYEEREAKAKKIGIYSKISTEMLRDLPQLTTYITVNMMKRMDIATENQLFSTNTGTGNNLIGLRSKAVAFTGGNLAGSVALANDFDVLNGIAAQVKAANGYANSVFVENSIVNRMLSNKTTFGQYLFPPGVMADANGNLTAFGLRVIGTNALAADEFVGGDLTAVNVRFRQGPTIEIDRDGNDFTNNLKTILMEQELVQFISANDVNVLIKGTFTAAKAALLAGS